MNCPRLLWFGVLSCLHAGCGESQGERAARREQELAPARYGPVQSEPCDPARGVPGFTETERTAKGVRFTVAAPRDYDPRRRHPLLVVFAPAGAGRIAVERASAFTQPATAAGFIAVYASHRPLGPGSTRELGTIASLVSAKWCVDESRVFYSGHSDGGTVSNALAALPDTRGRAAGIAPSAAGMTSRDLDAYGCPAPLGVMVLHGKRDKLFPGWGAQVARWWAGCNRCDAGRTISQPNGCVAYQGCDSLGPTQYCEGEGAHAEWPRKAQAVLEFFQAIPRKEVP